MHFKAALALLTVIFLHSPHLQAEKGNEEWAKVQHAMTELATPKERPKNRDEAIRKLKEGLEVYEKAKASALKTAPEHIVRWDAAIFELKIAKLRGLVSVPSQGGDVTIEDILLSKTASKDAKAQASAMQLMEQADFAQGVNGDISAWKKKADAHFLAYPEGSLNNFVKKKYDEFDRLASLRAAPLELKFKSMQGTEVDLAKLRGKVVLIDFWATWCGPCVAELPKLKGVYDDLHSSGFEVIGISLDADAKKLSSFIESHGMAWPQYFDGKGWKNDFSSKYGIHSIPTVWLVNKKGFVVDTSARQDMEAKVKKLLSE